MDTLREETASWDKSDNGKKRRYWLNASNLAWYILSGPVILQSNKKFDELKMAQAAQHETGNIFDQYWIVTLCLRDVLWIYLKKKNFILVIREFLFSCDFRIVKSWNRFVIHESRIVNSNPALYVRLFITNFFVENKF